MRAPHDRNAGSRRGRRGAGTDGSALRNSGVHAMRGGPSVDLILVRLLFVLVVAVTCYVIKPFGLPSKLDAGVGALVGLSIVLFEWRLRRVILTGLFGPASGSHTVICVAYMLLLVIIK